MAQQCLITGGSGAVGGRPLPTAAHGAGGRCSHYAGWWEDGAAAFVQLLWPCVESAPE